jgi:hypothetical protein
VKEKFMAEVTNIFVGEKQHGSQALLSRPSQEGSMKIKVLVCNALGQEPQNVDLLNLCRIVEFGEIIWRILLQKGLTLMNFSWEGYIRSTL